MRKPSQLNSRSSLKDSLGTKPVQIHKRASVPGKVFIHDEEHLFIAPLSNISVGGLFVDQLTAIPVGAEVRIVVKAPSIKEAIQLTGKVVRVEKDARKGIAVEFEKVSGHAKEVIDICVAESQMEQLLKAA